MLRKENSGNPGKFRAGATSNTKSPRWEQVQLLEKGGEDPPVCSGVSEGKSAGKRNQSGQGGFREVLQIVGRKLSFIPSALGRSRKCHGFENYTTWSILLKKRKRIRNQN